MTVLGCNVRLSVGGSTSLVKLPQSSSLQRWQILTLVTFGVSLQRQRVAACHHHIPDRLSNKYLLFLQASCLRKGTIHHLCVVVSFWKISCDASPSCTVHSDSAKEEYIFEAGQWENSIPKIDGEKYYISASSTIKLLWTLLLDGWINFFKVELLLPRDEIILNKTIIRIQQKKRYLLLLTPLATRLPDRQTNR